MELKEVTFSDLSPIKCKFLHSQSVNLNLILIVKFTGHYRHGSLGNPDSAFMNAMVTAALTAWEPRAVIIDLSQLNYIWGDMLEVVFPDDAGEIGDARVLSAIIVGDKCREAIRTLIFGINSSKSLSEVDWVHNRLDEALAYIERRNSAA